MRTRFWTAVRWLTGIAGAILLVHLVRSTGWTPVANALRSHWLFLSGMTVVYTSYHLLRTVTLQICIPQKTSFRDLFGIRLAGEAVAYLAIGSVLGDALKVALSRGRIPIVQSATGVFAEKLIYHLSGAAFILGGLVVALWKFGESHVLLYSIAGFTLLFFAMLFLMSSGVKPIARILRHVRVRKPALREAVLRTEEALFQFRRDHPSRFASAFVLDFLSFFYSVLEVYAVFRIIGLSPGFLELWYYQAIIKAVNTGMMVVPANLGIFEATSVYLSEQLKFGPEAGMITALFIRIRASLWSVIGYIWFLALLPRQREP